MSRAPVSLQRSVLSALLFGALLMASCAPFGYLTRIHPQDHEGPQAIQCAACHQEQYREWQGAAHARAFVSKTFQEAAGSPVDDECLKCHSPLGVSERKTEVRLFHQEEGVTCVSCHYSQGKMVGPHAPSALFTPHPIKEDAALYRSPGFCATCHEETYGQWQKIAGRQEVRSCQGCHQEEVQRRATRGTNFLSELLVSFEKILPTRSHEITLEKMANFPGGVSISAKALTTAAGTPVLAVTIANHLPHHLPTGTFGEKQILLSLSFEKEGSQGETVQVPVSDGQHPLMAGDSNTIIIPLSAAAILADTLRLDLARHSLTPEQKPPILLSSIVIDSIAEAFH
jgi:hypothetical protein